MCIIFVYFDPICKNGDYKLILAANRDEFYERPSSAAHFNGTDDNILCGLDLQDGVEGGTWLGVNKDGKISFLTNVLEPQISKSGKPRGNIVKNYLESAVDPYNYIQTKLSGVNYRPFNFVGGQISMAGVNLQYYSSKEKELKKISQGFHVIACTSLSSKWRKKEYGLELFKCVLGDMNRKSSQEIKDLLFSDVLSDKSSLFPDHLVKDQCESKLGDEFLQKYCSIMIEGLSTYGTVAQTVVLVDKNNHFYFQEKSCRNNAWETHSFDFLLI